MALHFSRIGTRDDLEIWSASSGGYSFVISKESRSGPGLRGRRPGFAASWRPVHSNRGAVRVSGSPFETFAKAQEACMATLGHLLRP